MFRVQVKVWAYGLYHNFSAALYANAKLVGEEEGVEKALAFTEVHAANSSGNGAADGNGTDVARLVFRDCSETLAALRSWFDIGSRELADKWLKDWVKSEPRVSSFENQIRMWRYVVPQGPGAEPVSARYMAVWYSSNGKVVGE